ncbi:MAG TPA: SDR family oxidoreductase [Rhizomicrobium sp.]|nr:SDR family oxidoreductase [Rhizomicrobium sp.]
MRIVVIGGTGRIGSRLVQKLRDKGHDVIAAAPSSGVNTLTGEGLAQAMAGAVVVVDVANSPSFEEQAAIEFFETSGRNIFAAEKAAGVKHHVALSVVGTERPLGIGYFRAKLAQEKLIKDSGIPYTILHSTQFFEFIDGIIQSGTEGNTFHVSPALVQPIAADDVAIALTALVLGAPQNATVEVAGPDACSLDTFAREYLAARGDTRQVLADVHARYFGAELDDDSLMPGDHPRFASTSFEDWLNRSLA